MTPVEPTGLQKPEMLARRSMEGHSLRWAHPSPQGRRKNEHLSAEGRRGAR
jgi:hypothetical protein